MACEVDHGEQQVADFLLDRVGHGGGDLVKFLVNLGLRALDVGCSSGIISSLLADACGSVIGIDVDETALRLARAEPKKPNLDFMVMSGSTLDFPSDAFDLVICNQVYYWLEDPDQLMDEIFRVLKPGGTCFFATVNKFKLWENQYRLPLLSVLPTRLADFLVRASGRGDRFRCHYLSFRQLGRLCRHFVRHRYTGRVLKDPRKYRITKLSTVQMVTHVLPLWLLDTLEPISPNMIWLLEKPRGGALPRTRDSRIESPTT